MARIIQPNQSDILQLWARYLEGDNISTKIESGRDRDRGGLLDFLKNRNGDRGGLSQNSGWVRGHQDFSREESRQVGIIQGVGEIEIISIFPRFLNYPNFFLSG